MEEEKKPIESEKDTAKTDEESVARSGAEASGDPAARTEVRDEQGVEAAKTSSTAASGRPSPKRYMKPLALGLGIALAVAVLWYLLSPAFEVAAKVNGETITADDVRRELESQAGQETLENMITEQLIMQAAASRGVVVADEDVSAQLDALKVQLDGAGQTLDTYLASQGLDRERFTERVRIQLMLQALVEDRVAVTDSDIDAYIEENADLLPEDIDVSDAGFRAQVRGQLEQQQLQSVIPAFLGELHADADVQYLKSY